MKEDRRPVRPRRACRARAERPHLHGGVLRYAHLGHGFREVSPTQGGRSRTVQVDVHAVVVCAIDFEVEGAEVE